MTHSTHIIISKETTYNVKDKIAAYYDLVISQGYNNSLTISIHKKDINEFISNLKDMVSALESFAYINEEEQDES